MGSVIRQERECDYPTGCVRAVRFRTAMGLGRQSELRMAKSHLSSSYQFCCFKILDHPMELESLR
jgi:hypothetical protein